MLNLKFNFLLKTIKNNNLKFLFLRQLCNIKTNPITSKKSSKTVDEEVVDANVKLVDTLIEISK